MNISGIGINFNRGRGIKCLETALLKGWMEPDRSSNHSIPSYKTPEVSFSDNAILKKIRRADRFANLAVPAAWDALMESGIPLKRNGTSLGIIVATAFGPYATNLSFVDDIFKYGELNTSPIIFANSVHNASASYLSSIFGSQGPTATITQFTFSFQNALTVASVWLKSGRCENVLIGAVDEVAALLEFLCKKKLRTAKDGKIKPFAFSRRPVTILGEGSVFFLLNDGKKRSLYGRIEEVTFSESRHENKPDLYLLDTDGTTGKEDVYLKSLSPDIPCAGYSPLFGGMMITGAFHCAVAALIFKNQKVYACPVQDNPLNVNLTTSTEPASVNSIFCVKYNCTQQKAVIKLNNGNS